MFYSFLVPSSVLDVSYQNVSSTSIHVSWIPPLNPNGRITHYTVYGLKLDSNQALKWMTNSTSLLIEGRVMITSCPWLLPTGLCSTSFLLVLFFGHLFPDLDKFTGYKLRVAASTTVGESLLSEEDDIFAFTLEDGTERLALSLAMTTFHLCFLTSFLKWLQ